MITVFDGDIPFTDPGPDPYRFESVEHRMKIALRLIGKSNDSVMQQMLVAWALEEPGKLPFPPGKIS